MVVAGAAGWLSFGVLLGGMMARPTPSAGFDLELLLTGGRRVAEGISPYEPSMLAGQSVGITTLFFSYPPLVAQALAPLATAPTILVLVALIVAGALWAAGVSSRLAAQAGVTIPSRRVFVAALAVLPFWFPFTVAMLFGNLDTLFLALYGLVLLAVLERMPSRRAVLWAGLALAVASVTKLHPAVLGVWLLARGVREWRRGEPRIPVLGIALPRSWAIAAVAAVAVLVFLAASLIVGGLGPWADYLTVLRASTVVDLLDPLNLGPAVQVALLFGLGSGSLAGLQAIVLVIALATAIVAALIVEDPLESLLWGAFASLVPLPVTWFHHFAALFPFGVAAVARSWGGDGRARRGVLSLVGLAMALGVIGFGIAIAWLLVPVLLVATRLSRSPAAG